MSEQSAYRAYLIGADGRIETASPLEAATDDEAMEQARQLVDGHDIELWDRGRLVVRLPSNHARSTFSVIR